MYPKKWIWLPTEAYPNNQTTNYSAFVDWNGSTNVDSGNFTVAEFVKNYSFSQVPVSVKLRFSGDTLFQLFCNGSCIATGPAGVGGDFLQNDVARKNYYAYEAEFKPAQAELNFFVRVQMMPDRFCDYSMGHGGFMLSGSVLFADGTTQDLCTDESWLVRKNGAYVSSCVFDGNVLPDAFVNAQQTEDIWHVQTAPIPVREEHKLVANGSTVTLASHESKVVQLDYDKIYAGFFCVKCSGGGVKVEARLRESDGGGGTVENVTLCGSTEYRGFYLHSVGNVVAKLQNLSDVEVTVDIFVIATNYPCCYEGKTVTSDNELNAVLDACKHTLKICRQTQHLDSPTHCEPLACTGDYYIESLMTLFSFGDMRLAEFDLLRTAKLLEEQNGRLFHTTYSLIFVRMLHDVYQITGNVSLLEGCKKGLQLLLERFESYVGTNGLVENAPDYMFVDWIYLDGLSLHHPPKALGQTCLNMFYFGALQSAAKIFDALGLSDDACSCKNRAERLRSAINSQLFDSEKGMYFAGLNTPTDESLLGPFMPQNVQKRYYIKHPNMLAAYFGVCDDAVATQLVEKVMENEIEGECQPYFLHYLLEAIFRLGLREKYTLKLLEQWKKPVAEFSKGLVEGFVAPEPTYQFDHSHAWGGTPLYSLPKALLGLEIISPGMKKIRLNPSLLGLEHALVSFATPFGEVTCRLQKGCPSIITAPKEVQVEVVD